MIKFFLKRVLKKVLFFFAISCGLLQASGHARRITNFVFSHGFASCKVKADAYKQARVIPPTAEQFNYSDACLSFEASQGYGIALDFWNSCIGQSADVDRLAHEVNKYDEPVVLFGESRGAATIINYLASKHATSGRVVAAVLDSPFDRLKSVLALRLKLLGLQRLLSPESIERLVPYICLKYKPHGAQPIESIEKINPTIPLMLIASTQDDIVPHACSIELYKKLLKQGHERVYLLLLSQGKHGWIMQGPKAKIYRKVVYAFYQKYSIDHGIQDDHEMSTSSYDILQDLCKPTLEQLANLESITCLETH
ncbi:MAG: prolyl oligopeptidase family serine peptidase [Candidatus Babeliaceae bacterium]|nr:prolyl oligopeptidase family serine peptidase [Candidatus Babeliaceae bacterium]